MAALLLFSSSLHLLVLLLAGLWLAEATSEVAAAGGSVRISFVTHYLDPVGQKSFIFHQLAKANKTVPAKYLMVLESARKHHRGANAVVFTDQLTSFRHAADRNLTIVRGPKFRLVGRAMVARYEAWAEYVQKAIDAGDDRHIVFADDDVIFTADVAHVFEPGLGPGPLLSSAGGGAEETEERPAQVSDWAVGLTYCNGSQERLETGIVFVNGRRLPHALAFFSRAVALTTEPRTDRSTWFAQTRRRDQQLLAHVLDKAAIAGTSAPAPWFYTTSTEGVPILMLPCTEFNYMPLKHGRAAEDLARVKVVQFQAISAIAMWHVWSAIEKGRGLEGGLALLPRGPKGHGHNHFKATQYVGGKVVPP